MIYVGGFLKWWYPTTIGFPTQNAIVDDSGMILGCPPTQDAIVTNEGLGWDSRSEKWNNSEKVTGHPEWGVVPRYDVTCDLCNDLYNHLAKLQ